MDKTDWYWKMFLDGSNRDHEAVNVNGPKALDILNVDYPKSLLFFGGFDSLVNLERKWN
ncbi:putative carboxylesterase [Medicago truncatula]|uniref:Carboxylesterase, putative n=1 Tax=Medicago truncatula TaxID=3880 RepID=G7KP88_MEDTR|nr:carboxylesterase, putative [Medicago truncatula]RHN52153.1 putative carboxylesterase [Medicago truncatula]